MYCGDEVGAFVGDVGTLSSKFGYAGEDTPNCILPSVVGSKANAPRSVLGHSALYAAQDIDALPAAISLVDDKNAYDWDVVEVLWAHAFDQLHVNPTEHAILASLSPFDMAVAPKYMELMFETFRAPAFYLAKDAVLNAFSFGKSTALVADVGAGSTRVVPVVDGFVLHGSAQRSVVGGEALNAQMQKMLQDKHGVEIAPCVRKYETEATATPTLSEAYLNFRRLEVVRDIKESVCLMPETTLNEELADSTPAEAYELPDGHVVSMGSERFKIPEKLMHPDVIGADSTTVATSSKGLHRMLYSAVQSSDVDVRRELLHNLVLCGGGAGFQGLTERVHWEMSQMVPSSLKVRITQTTPVERKFSTWIGGSILASLGSFQQLWVSKREFEERGADHLIAARFL
ncbi:actin-like protein [Achlya hypogyna]|uniref:Actin-like protein n=1 Tax=Achlya hypogyna TaxID=1202772 RepID=A0A1V9ZFG2_ACHHY|nr:actin-like protein [Achlya hypogyna]